MLSRPRPALPGLFDSLWVALVMAVPLFVNPYSRFNFEPDKAALLRAASILLVLAAALALPRLARGAARRLLRPLPILALILWLLVGCSALASLEPGRSVWGEPRWGQGWITFTCFLVIFGLASAGLADEPRRHTIVDMALLASLPVALYGLAQAAGLDPLSMAPPSERIQSTQPHANALGGYLAMMIPLALHRLLKSPGRVRLWWGGLLAAQALCLLLTVSRSSYLAAAFGGWLVLALAAWYAHRKRLAAALCLAALLIIGALVVLSLLPPPPAGAPEVWQAAASLFRASSPTVQVRALVWRSTLDAIARRPWLGYGPETFDLALPAAMDPRLVIFGGLDAVAGRVHNELLELALFSGIPAALAYALLITLAARRGWRRLSGGDPLAGPLLASASAGLIHHLLDVTTITTGIFFWLWLGMLAAQAWDAMLLPGTRLIGDRAARWLAAAVAAVLIGWACVLPVWADIAGREGMALGGVGAWAGAEDALAHAGLLDPRPQVYALPRAEVEIAQYQADHDAAALDRAAVHLEDAIRLMPSDTDLWSKLVEVRRIQAVEVDARFWPQAYAGCQSLLLEAPHDPNAFLQCGDLRLWARQPAGAIPYYQAAALLAPDYDQPYFDLSTAYRALGQTAQADRFNQLATQRQQAWLAVLSQR